MKTKLTYPIKSLKKHKIDRKELAKEEAKALVKDRMSWLREEVKKLKDENRSQFLTIAVLKTTLKEKEIARSTISSKHFATRATMRKIRTLLDKDYQFNA